MVADASIHIPNIIFPIKIWYHYISNPSYRIFPIYSNFKLQGSFLAGAGSSVAGQGSGFNGPLEKSPIKKIGFKVAAR